MENQEEDYLPSLITASPFEGRQLAIKLARKSIGAIQPDAGASGSSCARPMPRTPHSSLPLCR